MFVFAGIVRMTFDREVLDIRVCDDRCCDLIEQGVGFFLNGGFVVIEINLILDFDLVIQHEDDLFTLIRAAIIIFITIDGFRFCRALVGSAAILGILFEKPLFRDPRIADTIVIIIGIRAAVFIFEVIEIFSDIRTFIGSGAEVELEQPQFFNEGIAQTIGILITGRTTAEFILAGKFRTTV